MTTLKARNLSLNDVHRLLGIQLGISNQWSTLSVCPTYQHMPILNFFERDRSIQLQAVAVNYCTHLSF